MLVKFQEISNDISIAQGIILPGVGSFEKGMVNLKKYRLIDILKNEVIMKKKIFGYLSWSSINL